MVQQGGAAAWGSGGTEWGPPAQGGPGPAAGGFSPPPSSTPDWQGGSPAGPDSAGGVPISAPMLWLAVAAGLEVVGLVLGLVAGDNPALSIAGWLIGGFGAISVLAWFTLADSKRRASAWYTAGAAPSAIRGVLALAAVVVVAINAYGFADWASRQ